MLRKSSISTHLANFYTTFIDILEKEDIINKYHRFKPVVPAS